MNGAQWQAFSDFKTAFKAKTTQWQQQIEKNGLLEKLRDLQRQAANCDGVPPYSLDTPIVYNRALDDVLPSDDIKIILIGDNPGKDEQLKANRRYLVGQSGKIANGFFRKNPELEIDFRKNVLILNKTPLHTAKPKELSILIKSGESAFADIIRESQIWLAENTVKLHAALCGGTEHGADTNCSGKTAAGGAARYSADCSLWLVGYAELKARGLFCEYKNALNAAYGALGSSHSATQNVFVYQHFSMNRFLIDLKERSRSDLSLTQNLRSVGIFHRNEILGW